MAAELAQVTVASTSHPVPRNPSQRGFVGLFLFLYLCRVRNFRREYELRKKGGGRGGVRREVRVCGVFRG